MPTLAKLAAAFSLGVAAGSVLPSPPGPAVAAAACAAILLGICARARLSVPHAAVACALVAGWCRAPLLPPSERGAPESPPCTRVVAAKVVEPPSRVRDGLRAELLADAATACAPRPEPPAFQPIAARVSLTVLGPETPALYQGERILVRATVKRPPDYANFGGAHVRLPSDDRLSAVAEGAGSVARASRERLDLHAPLAAIRARLSSFWSASIGTPIDGLARALVLGETSALDPGQRSRFRRTGTAHLLAVSGLHLAILTWLVFGALRLALLRVTPLARRCDVGRFAAAATIPVLVAFALLVGGRPPVVRSCVMASSVLLARASGRRGGAVEGVSLAAAGLLAFDPTDIADPGFQLSFAAVISFLLGARPRRRDPAPGRLEPPGPKSRPRLLAAAAARAAGRLFFGSLAATAATTPIALYHFDQVSAVAIPCNMLAIPFVSGLVMPALFAVSAAALAAPAAASIGAAPVGAMLRALDAALGFVAGHHLAAVEGPGPLLSPSVVVCSAAGLAFAARRSVRAFAAWVAALGLAVASALADDPPTPRGRLVVDVLDVGQGSASLVAFPDGERLLVDAGGSAAGPDLFGEKHLVPILRGLGARAIGTVVLTHGDPDHVVGAAAALRSFGVRRVLISGAAEEEGRGESGSPYREALDTARRAGAEVLTAPGICGGQTIAGVRVEVLHPCFGARGRAPGLSVNDNSVALRLSYGATAVLLPGDLSREGEALLLRSGAPLRADVLVLGHHGSDSSSAPEFLDAVRPAVAIASVGRDNRYGFPRPQVVLSLARRGARLYRTDRDGAIRIVSDGAQISASPARAR